jgi:hypothetical protein
MRVGAVGAGPHPPEAAAAHRFRGTALGAAQKAQVPTFQGSSALRPPSPASGRPALPAGERWRPAPKAAMKALKAGWDGLPSGP